MGNENRIRMNVDVIKDGAKIPTQAEGGAVDLYACLDCASVAVLPHKTRDVPCGIAITIENGYMLLICPAIDESKCVDAYLYPKEGENSELLINLKNNGNFEFTVHNGMCIARGVVVPTMQIEIIHHP